MDYALISIPNRQRCLNRQDLINISKTIIQKEFEILRIQEKFISIFGELEIYSKQNFDFSGVETAYQLATGDAVDEGCEPDFYWLVLDAVLPIAFSYKDEDGCQILAIEDAAKKFTDLLFRSALEESEIERQVVFIKDLRKEFQNINTDYIDRKFNQLEYGLFN